MLDLVFTNPDNTLLEKMAVTPGMVERLSSNIEDLTSFSKAYLDYEKARQDVYLDVKSAYINLMNSRDGIGVAKLALQQAKEQQYQALRR